MASIEHTPSPARARGGETISARWLLLNALALAFSLAHHLLDWSIGLFGASSKDVSARQAALVTLVCAVYAWWGAALVGAARGDRASLLGIAALNGGWVVLGNGLPILFCLPPCDGAFPYQDLAHVGSLLFGALAAYASWRAARAAVRPLGRGGWGPFAVALVAVVALFALEASLNSG